MNPQIIDRLSSYMDEVEKIIIKTENNSVMMAKIYIENTLLSKGDKKFLNKYAYDYFREIEYSNQD